MPAVGAAPDRGLGAGVQGLAAHLLGRLGQNVVMGVLHGGNPIKGRSDGAEPFLGGNGGKIGVDLGKLLLLRSGGGLDVFQRAGEDIGISGVERKAVNGFGHALGQVFEEDLGVGLFVAGDFPEKSGQSIASFALGLLGI